MIRRMRFECWITKAADKYLEYVMLIAIPWNEWLRERYVIRSYIGCLVAFDSSSLQNIAGYKRPEHRAQILTCLICRRYKFTVFYVHFFPVLRGFRPEREADHYVPLISTLNHSPVPNYPSRGD